MVKWTLIINYLQWNKLDQGYFWQHPKWKCDDLTNKYLLRWVYEVYDKGSDAESKYQHHLEEKKNSLTKLHIMILRRHLQYTL